jgi:hypothetical protein
MPIQWSSSVKDAIEIPMENEEFPVEPPIVDFLYLNAESSSYVITFIPADRASRQEKEIVQIPENSVDGRRIQVRINEIEKALGGHINRLFHAGDGDFGFVFADGRQKQLSDVQSTAANSQYIYIQLQDLGMIAQIAFHENQLLKNQAG